MVSKICRRAAAAVLFCALIICIPLAAGADEGQKKVRLFILSGQSNMAGLKPQVSFTPAVTKAFADDEVIVVKDAKGGQPIRRWFKEWKPPANAKFTSKGKNGDLYDRLMKKVREAVGKKNPATISFVWMQGERDARENFSSVYAKSLQGLVKQLRDDMKRPDITVVIGRLSDCRKGQKQWDGVRDAQVKVAKDDPLADWVDTDDLNGPKNALHYTRDGYAVLGRRFAEKCISLLRKKSAK